MGFWKSFRFWVKDTIQSRGSVRIDYSVSRTIKDATHVRGGGQQAGGFSSTDDTIEMAIEGHEDYQKSFKKNR